ncbi:hypothetical protein [Zavarzinia sp. CC-PAN008]|uniref:hypothetical protein n=1 Tax=Zavarzinia sp. CC-PAN008 TaxID=3243332 RepID=UPI003F74482D
MKSAPATHLKKPSWPKAAVVVVGLISNPAAATPPPLPNTEVGSVTICFEYGTEFRFGDFDSIERLIRMEIDTFTSDPKGDVWGKLVIPSTSAIEIRMGCGNLFDKNPAHRSSAIISVKDIWLCRADNIECDQNSSCYVIDKTIVTDYGPSLEINPINSGAFCLSPEQTTIYPDKSAKDIMTSGMARQISRFFLLSKRAP